jgi:hypothetical protein
VRSEPLRSPSRPLLVDCGNLAGIPPRQVPRPHRTELPTLTGDRDASTIGRAAFHTLIYRRSRVGSLIAASKESAVLCSPCGGEPRAPGRPTSYTLLMSTWIARTRLARDRRKPDGFLDPMLATPDAQSADRAGVAV